MVTQICSYCILQMNTMKHKNYDMILSYLKTGFKPWLRQFEAGELAAIARQSNACRLQPFRQDDFGHPTTISIQQQKRKH